MEVSLKITVLASALLVSFSASAQQNHHGHASPYAGQESREIKSLSSDDLAELERGGGWGFAKSAELNGIPGPSHVLAMEKELALTLSQLTATREIFEQMQKAAVDEGRRLISLEAELESGFQDRSMDKTELRQRLSQIEKSRANLRFLHLAAHLEMGKILATDQIEKYNELRGYAAR